MSDSGPADGDDAHPPTMTPAVDAEGDEEPPNGAGLGAAERDSADSDRGESGGDRGESERSVDGAFVADLFELVAGAAAVSGAGLALAGGLALVGALVLGESSPVLRFGGLAGVSIGLFLLYWGVSTLQADG